MIGDNLLNRGVFWVETTAHSQKMDFCTLADFLDHLLPHVTGPLAASIKLARGRTATLVSDIGPLAVAHSSAKDMHIRTTAHLSNNMDATIFDSSKAGDLTYCLSYFRLRIHMYNDGRSSKSQIQLHETCRDSRSLFGVVDMMFCIGEYASRDDARRQWTRVRENTRTGLSNSREAARQRSSQK